MRIHRLPLLLLLATGCTEDQQLLEQTEITIGPSGGRALSADGKMTLTIPQGALSRDTRITILTRRDIAHDRLRSKAYELGPDGQTFTVPIRAEISVDSVDDLALANLDNGYPEIVAGSAHDRGEKLVRGDLTHFSSYGAVTSSLFSPCLNVPCGSPCTICDPNDPGCNPPPNTSCDSNGNCIGTSSVSCNPQNPSAHFILDPDSLALGPIDVGGSVTGVINVRNIGDAPGDVISYTMSATVTDFFGPIVPLPGNPTPPPVTVAPGSSLELTVGFAPEDVSPQVRNTTLNIETSVGSLSAWLTGLVFTSSTSTTCTESFARPSQGKVDILMIVDNSCSMAEEQFMLSQSAPTVINALTNLDYHIGVTTTDVGFLGEGGVLVESNGISIVDQNTPSPEAVLQDLVNVGFDGGGLEQGFDAIQLALTLSSSAGPNLGFLRREAWLAVVVVSDEDDGSILSAQEIVDFLNSLKAPAGSSMIRLNGVTGEAAGCGGSAAPAPRYQQAISSTNGVSDSICSSDWIDALTDLGGVGLGFPFQFPLRGYPASATIQVLDTTGNFHPWSYDSPTNTIVVQTSSGAQALGDIIVTYEGNCF